MIIKESVSRDLFRLIVWFPLRWFMALLPFPAGIAVLRAMGDVHYAFSKRKRSLLKAKLALISPCFKTGMSEDAIIRDYFRNHYIDRLLIFLFHKLNKVNIKRHVEISGLENLDMALTGKKGVVLVHGHFGPVHLPLVSLALLGYRMKQIGLPSDEGLSWVGRRVAFRLRLKYEGRIPAEIIKADSFLRGAFRWLNENGIIMITGDGTGTRKKFGKYESFDFFSHPVQFPLGPALLADKTGAVMLPMFIVHGEKKLYHIIIEGPFIGNGGIREVTEHFVKNYERRIALCPGYMHFLDRLDPGEAF